VFSSLIRTWWADSACRSIRYSSSRNTTACQVRSTCCCRSSCTTACYPWICTLCIGWDCSKCLTSTYAARSITTLPCNLRYGSLSKIPLSVVRTRAAHNTGGSLLTIGSSRTQSLGIRTCSTVVDRWCIRWSSWEITRTHSILTTKTSFTWWSCLVFVTGISKITS
jgi:hypothetical protein